MYKQLHHKTSRAVNLYTKTTGGRSGTVVLHGDTMQTHKNITINTNILTFDTSKDDATHLNGFQQNTRLTV